MAYKTQDRILLQKFPSTNQGHTSLVNRQKETSNWSLSALITIENSVFVLEFPQSVKSQCVRTRKWCFIRLHYRYIIG